MSNDEIKHPCIKKRWFIFPYTSVEHQYKIIHIWKFMYCSVHFMIEEECTVCGLRREKSFIDADELLNKGFTSLELNSITDNKYDFKLYNQTPTP